MKVFFYNSDNKIPFQVLYADLDSWNNLIISNHEQYTEQFEKYKAQLMDLVGDETTDKTFFVPNEVKEIFLNWLAENEKIDWNQKEVVSKPVMTAIIGEDKLNNFLQEMDVKEEWESVVKPNEPNLTKKELSVKKTTTHSKNFLVVIGIIAIIISVFYFDDNKRSSKKEYGQLTITTDCYDCKIYINGKDTKQQTPIMDIEIVAGNNIKIKLVNHKNVIAKCTTVDLSPDESKNLGNNHFQDCN